jgi:biopolymer transport protein TolR
MAFGKMHSSSEEHEDLAEINIIPLVDVMLVLLIVFMVAAPLSISGIKVELPTSKTKEASVGQSNIILSITKEGHYYIDKMRIPQGELGKKIQALFAYRDNKELFIRADRAVDYGVVVDAMSAAKMAGVHKMGMLTKPDTMKSSSKRPSDTRKRG